MSWAKIRGPYMHQLRCLVGQHWLMNTHQLSPMGTQDVISCNVLNQHAWPCMLPPKKKGHRLSADIKTRLSQHWRERDRTLPIAHQDYI